MPTPSLPKLGSSDEIDSLLTRSASRPVIVFKHSLTCPISSAAYRRFLRFVDTVEDEQVELALVEVQNARDVSNEIAARTGVRHESPQALLFRDGEVAWHASHGSIHEDSLTSALDGDGA